ncbi:MAG: sugar transferase [Planctomycetota bacterium]
MKRLFDVALSLLSAVILLPVFAVIVIAIRISSKGAAVFKQERTGKDGKPSVFYKLRSMKLDADPFGTSLKTYEDIKPTRIEKLN